MYRGPDAREHGGGFGRTSKDRAFTGARKWRNHSSPAALLHAGTTNEIAGCHQCRTESEGRFCISIPLTFGWYTKGQTDSKLLRFR